jgi:hypothetical protein
MSVVSTRTQTGSLFARTAAALALNKGQSLHMAGQYASERWRDTPEIGLYLERAAVSLTDSTDALVAPGTVEFLNLVRPRTVLGRLTRLAKVPFHRGAAIASGGAQFSWIGEGAATPVGKLEWSPASLPVRKVGGIAVTSNELLQLETADAETAFMSTLVTGLAAFTDEKFLSTDAEVVDVSPAGILADADATASVDDPAADLATLLDGFDSLDGVTIVLSEKSAIALSGQGAYRNGLLSDVLPVLLSSAADDNIIAIQAPRVLFADEGQTEIGIARHASLQMDTEPTNAPDAATTLVSLWQSNAVAVKVMRYLNWSALEGSVRVITGVTY